jgi:hypothetical protein
MANRVKRHGMGGLERPLTPSSDERSVCTGVSQRWAPRSPGLVTVGWVREIPCVELSTSKVER